MHVLLKTLVLVSLWGQAVSFAIDAPTVASNRRTATVSKASLSDYAPAAASLFGNMITPASILGGSIVPLGFAAPLSIEPEEGDGVFAKCLRRAYPFAAIITFASNLLAVMWATIAVNQLTEQKVELAASVWDLIQRDLALPWAATNSHFCLGMLSFMWVISSKAYFLAAKGKLGKSVMGLGFSSLLYIVSIVNRAVAAGGGEKGLRFGKSILSLFTTYVCLLWKRALQSFGILECTAIILAIVSLVSGARTVFQE